jgi:hypothetical protein
MKTILLPMLSAYSKLVDEAQELHDVLEGNNASLKLKEERAIAGFLRAYSWKWVQKDQYRGARDWYWTNLAASLAFVFHSAILTCCST